MRSKLLLFAIILSMFNRPASGQIVGGNVFLQGHYVEVGETIDGAMGVCTTPPTGYHHSCSDCPWTTSLAQVYDYGHDGWTVGTPAFMGDYTNPGFPQEGWTLQANGNENWAFQNYCGGITGSGYLPSGTLTGAVSSYSNAGGRIIGNWAGSAVGGNLTIKQETRVDTEASWIVFTVFFHNTGSSAINNVYYMRTCDPDNESTWGWGPTTHNTIVYQHDTDNRVMVSSYGTHYGSAVSYMAIGTKDCRAKCCIFNGGLQPEASTQAIYNGTGFASGYLYTLGAFNINDVGIALVYDLGNIPAGDSAVISYAYIFNGNTGIDSAFPDPELVIDGTVVPNNDSFFVPYGVDTVKLAIRYGSDKDWTWSDWTWSPGTALSDTTGTGVIDLYVRDLAGPVTYTVTGNDSSGGSHGGAMFDCGHKQFVFTIIPPHYARANSPCVGDTLYLTYVGYDTLGSTYFWYGPGGFTSVLRNPFIFPATMADSGIYTLVKTQGSIVDTYTVHVTIHPLPVVNVSSNIPLCGVMRDTLDLYAGPDTTGETFSWTGPNGFSSQYEYPVLSPFDSTDQGIYSVTVVSPYGCINIGSIGIYAGTAPSFTFSRHYGCDFDTVYFTDNTTNADTYSWNFGDGSPTNTNRDCYHVYSSHDLFYVTLHCSNPHCDSSLTLPVDLRHSVKALFSPVPDTFCAGQSTVLMDSSYSYLGYGFRTLYSNDWNFGDGSTDATFGPSHTYTLPGIYPITLVVKDSIGCEDSVTKDVYVLLLSLSSLHDTMLCVSQPLPLTNVLSVVPDISLAYSYQWSPGADLSDSTVEVPNFFGLGLFTYTLTASVVPYGCTATDVITINSVMGKVLADVTVTSTISLGSSIQLNADSEIVYWWKPNDGTLDNPNINDPIATPTHTTLYTVYGYDVNGCLDSAYVEIIVDSTMEEEIPGAFTPNGDGLNDVFKPIGEKFQSMVEFRVYNRWGQQMFYSNNFNQGWDGTFNGVAQELGVYFYTVTVARPGGAGDNIVYKGEVTLIR